MFCQKSSTSTFKYLATIGPTNTALCQSALVEISDSVFNKNFRSDIISDFFSRWDFSVEATRLRI